MQDLSLNILDVAQNSVAAGAGLVTITRMQNLPQGWLTILIEDDGCGMTPEQVQRVVDPFYTTRTTRKVGLGVPFFKMAAELTGGSFEITSKPGEGTRVCARFDLTHIDCNPVGDLSATICCLIQCNPDMEFVYKLHTPKGEFTADTREFRQVLGEDVPLSEPRVLTFIKSYIDENSAELLS